MENLLIGASELAGRDDDTGRAPEQEVIPVVVSERKSEFRMRKVAFAVHGLQPELATSNWVEIRDLIYVGRGG